jgi:hypothetical protein
MATMQVTVTYHALPATAHRQARGAEPPRHPVTLTLLPDADPSLTLSRLGLHGPVLRAW